MQRTVDQLDTLLKEYNAGLLTPREVVYKAMAECLEAIGNERIDLTERLQENTDAVKTVCEATLKW